MNEKKIENLAREIFENQRAEDERWEPMAMRRAIGKNVIAGIGEARRNHFRNLAKEQLGIK